MADATIERQVEDVYNEGISFYFNEEDGSPLKIKYPYSCDGLIETKTEHGKMLKLLMEFKFDYDFSNKVARAKVIAQALFYIKRFEIDGSKLPNVVLIGDKNECFVFHTNDIIKYLDKDLDWKIAASAAAEKNPDLVLEIANDNNLNPFIFVINEDFSFKSVVDKINELAENIQRYVHVTEHNISNIFDYFTSRVVKNVKKISPNDIVAIFIGIITDSDNYYLHPKKPNIILTPFGDIQIDASQYQGFIKYFNRSYTPQEKMKFAEISDRLIEDTNRRNKGEFYTPTLFVDYAHKMISDALGENWKDEYVVWDNCCGTKNLTRDYRFNELYCSTLEKAELDISKKYNPEAESFVFDFLNDPIVGRGSLVGVYDDKLPKGLKDALLENKPIVFFLNPPYGMASGFAGIDAGASDTLVKKQMQKENIEGSEFIKQFLWRIVDIKRKFNLTNLYIACYTKPTWLIKPKSENFRKLFLNNFEYQKGIMFNAGEFANVSAAWGITFNIWKSGISKDKNNFIHQLVENNNQEIKIIGDKALYNFDGQQIITTSDFVTKNLGKKHKENVIICKNINTMEFIKKESNICDDYIATIHVHANDISNNNWTCIRQVCTDGNTKPLTKNNIFESSIVLFIRTNVECNWINDKDMYNMNVEIPISFRNDAFVYSIFGNYCCSIKLDNDRLKNEFFWMSKSEIEDLANTYKNDDCYADVHTASERFVYQKLQEIELSPEAQAVLDKASEIVRKTFKYRKLFNDIMPEAQINNWDCGFYQIKLLCKEFAPDLLKEFKDVYKQLVDKMRPMVYELGFLK